MEDHPMPFEIGHNLYPALLYLIRRDGWFSGQNRRSRKMIDLSSETIEQGEHEWEWLKIMV